MARWRGVIIGAVGAAAMAAAPTAWAAPNVYVANQASNNVSAFSIGAGGGLSAVSGSPFGAGSAPVGVAVTPDGTHVYVVNDVSANVSAFSVGAGGGLTVVSGSPFSTGSYPGGLAVTPDGTHLYVPNFGSGTVSAFSI